jgi:uncharacterized membrane protein required for colicin V production
MILDLAVLALIGLFAVGGYSSGAVRQISHAIGLIAAYLFSKPAAILLGPVLAARMNWPEAQAVGGLSLALMPVIFIGAALISRLLLNILEPGDERGPLDQGLGVLVGGAKGGAILFVLLCLTVSGESMLKQLNVDINSTTAGSFSMAFARGHNLFAQNDPLALVALKKLTEARNDPKARNIPLKGRNAKALLANSRLARKALNVR